MFHCSNAIQVWCKFTARAHTAHATVSEGWAPSLPPSPCRPSLGNYSVGWEHELTTVESGIDMIIERAVSRHSKVMQQSWNQIRVSSVRNFMNRRRVAEQRQLRQLWGVSLLLIRLTGLWEKLPTSRAFHGLRMRWKLSELREVRIGRRLSCASIELVLCCSVRSAEGVS